MDTDTESVDSETEAEPSTYLIIEQRWQELLRRDNTPDNLIAYRYAMTKLVDAAEQQATR